MKFSKKRDIRVKWTWIIFRSNNTLSKNEILYWSFSSFSNQLSTTLSLKGVQSSNSVSIDSPTKSLEIQCLETQIGIFVDSISKQLEIKIY